MKVLYPDLEAKQILITGATRGIGLAIAKSLAEQKAHVVFNYRSDPERAEQLKSELEGLGGKATALKFDITQSDQIKSAISEFIDANGPITGLVNNAGISKDQLILRLKEDDIDATLDTNLKGPLLVSWACTRGFLKGENVSVVNVSSIAGLMGNASQVTYSASKSGLLGLTKSFAKELASRNIRCNAICPGFIETDMTQSLSEERKSLYKENIPLGRFGQVEDVANLTCFLLSAASAYITGEIIKIDGGLYI